jgi:hypothetical protein
MKGKVIFSISHKNLKSIPFQSQRIHRHFQAS